MISLSMTLLIIGFVASIFISIYFKKKRKKFESILFQKLINKDYFSFDKMIQSKTAKKIIPPFDLLLLSFNSYILRKNYSKLNSIFDRSAHIYMSNKQKIRFYGQALQFFAEKKDYKRSKICYQKIQSIKGYEHSKGVLNELYEVMILNNVKYIKTIEKRLTNENIAQQINDYRLLEHLYEIKKDSNTVDKLKRIETQKVQLFYK